MHFKINPLKLIAKKKNTLSFTINVSSSVNFCRAIGLIGVYSMLRLFISNNFNRRVDAHMKDKIPSMNIVPSTTVAKLARFILNPIFFRMNSLVIRVTKNIRFTNIKIWRMSKYYVIVDCNPFMSSSDFWSFMST